MAVYLTISLSISLFMNWYNRASRWWSAEPWQTTCRSRATPHRPTPPPGSSGHAAGAGVGPLGWVAGEPVQQLAQPHPDGPDRWWLALR